MEFLRQQDLTKDIPIVGKDSGIIEWLIAISIAAIFWGFAKLLIPTPATAK